MDLEGRDSYVLFDNTTLPTSNVTQINLKGNNNGQVPCLSQSFCSNISEGAVKSETTIRKTKNGFNSPLTGFRKIRVSPHNLKASNLVLCTTGEKIDSQILSNNNLHGVIKVNSKSSEKKDSQFWLFSASVTSVIALVFTTISVSFSEWLTTKISCIGLWQICITGNCSRYTNGLGILAFLFDIIGLSSPYWFTYGEVHSYLFKGCMRGTCRDIKDASSEVEATQAMVIIGFLAGAAAVILLVVYILVLNNKMVRLGSMIAAFAGAGFTLIGVIIIGDFNGGFLDIGWAMVLSILGALLYIAVGVLVILDVVKT